MLFIVRCLIVLGVLGDCSDCFAGKKVSLWISQDATLSFESAFGHASMPPLLRKFIEDIGDSVDYLKFGLSMFGDRQTRETCAGCCYMDGVELLPSSNESLDAMGEYIKGFKAVSGGKTDPEDSMSSMAYISSKKFGALEQEEGELRLLLTSTDDLGHFDQDGFGDPLTCGDQELPEPVTEKIYCDRKYKYPTIEVVAEALQMYNVKPIILVTAKHIEQWTKNLLRMGINIDAADGLVVELGSNSDPATIIENMKLAVEQMLCNIAAATTTKAPVTTTPTKPTTTTTTTTEPTTTTTTTTTTEPTTTTTTEPTTTTTTEPTTTTTTTTEPTTTTTTTTEPTTTTTTTTTEPTTTTTTTTTATTTEPTTTTSTTEPTTTNETTTSTTTTAEPTTLRPTVPSTESPSEEATEPHTETGDEVQTVTIRPSTTSGSSVPGTTPSVGGPSTSTTTSTSEEGRSQMPVIIGSAAGGAVLAVGSAAGWWMMKRRQQTLTE